MRSQRFLGLLVVVSLCACSSSKSKSNDRDVGIADAGTDPSLFDASVDALGDDGGVIVDAGIDVLDAAPEVLLGDPCNGSVAYCDKKYDELAYVATHESAGSIEAKWVYPTQTVPVFQQLQRGIRALMFTVQEQAAVRRVCVGDCSLGSTLFTAELARIKTFLDENPREIVSLILDASTVPSASLVADFEAKGLDLQAFVPTGGAAWPTLAELIEGTRRLVVLASASDTGPAWLISRGGTLWETESSWATLASMNCNAAVGTSNLSLSLVHHRLSAFDATADAGVGSSNSATQANDLETVVARLNQCREQYGRVPNFVSVDFFETGDVVGATQILNGIREP